MYWIGRFLCLIGAHAYFEVSRARYYEDPQDCVDIVVEECARCTKLNQYYDFLN